MPTSVFWKERWFLSWLFSTTVFNLTLFSGMCSEIWQAIKIIFSLLWSWKSIKNNVEVTHAGSSVKDNIYPPSTPSLYLSPNHESMFSCWFKYSQCLQSLIGPLGKHLNTGESSEASPHKRETRVRRHSSNASNTKKTCWFAAVGLNRDIMALHWCLCVFKMWMFMSLRG